MTKPENFENRCFYRKKLTAEQCNEMQTMFADSFAVCFELKRDLETGRRPVAMSLWYLIVKELPNAYIMDAELLTGGSEPTVKGEQVLIILNKNSAEESEKLMKLLEESGKVDTCYLIFSKKKEDDKGCVRVIFGSDKPAIVKKANLLVDRDKLLLTVRTRMKK